MNLCLGWTSDLTLIMVMYSVYVSLVILCTVRALDKENCNSCVPVEKCRMLSKLNEDEKGKWRERFSCDDFKKKDEIVPSGFSAVAKGDLVCCPENVWGVENPYVSNDKQTNPDLAKEGGFSKPNADNYNTPVNSGNYNSDDGGKINDPDDNSDIEANRSPYWTRPNVQNPYFLPANSNVNNNIRNTNNYNTNRNTNNYNNNRNDRTNSRRKCAVTNFPPDPASGCCGLEASEDDDTNSQQSNSGQIYNNNGWNNWMPRTNNWLPSWMLDSENSRKKRDENGSVTIENRIAGGQETDLDQFPWTVLLKTTFLYPTKEVAFACGGSLISSRYVLTAGHCVFDPEGGVKGIEVTLSEYDKRTFPKDCKFQPGRGEVCVENIVMQAEDFTLHPAYDDNKLFNDIAVVRLRGIAPYNNYIRPICLPPIDIDSPDLTNLRLAVAGWGRNGNYKSDIKQSTVVNLVPQRECRKSYPSLTRKQVCAAGYSGEDTCKGDSGGPLMMKYNGKYYLSGVVSGKRADAPCGTSVPSLYTNVYQYVDWIRSVIKN